MQHQPKFRRTVIVTVIAIVGLLAASLVATAAPNGSTAKNLSSNFTLVNLSTGVNNVSINYYKPDGTPWRASETAVLATQGAQVQYKQYFDPLLTPGSGSVVVGGSGAMGGVVQILARDQTASSGAYSGASQGAQTFNVPLVAKNASSGDGIVNSQLVVQNTGATTTFTVDIVRQDGTIARTTDPRSLNSGAAFTYDLADDAAVPTGFYSAVVKAASGGQVAVVVNLFLGANMLQSYSGFASTATKWIAPLVFSRLQSNNMSSPITVQNLSGSPMIAGDIKLSCIGTAPFGNLTITNPTPLADKAFASFNPVTNTSEWPTGWYGSCTIDTTGKASVVFVQLREVGGGGNGAAYEGIRADGTKKKVIIPLFVKRGSNGFATVTNVQNLSTTTAASVVFSYKAGDGQPSNCNLDVPATIPPGASVMQNLRIPSGDNSVPSLPDGCVGAIVVTASTDTPIDAVVQLTNFQKPPGDTFMAHDGFTAD